MLHLRFWIGMLLRVAFVIALVTAVSAKKARFDNYELHRVVPRTERQLELLHQMEDAVSAVNFWNSPTRLNSSVDIMVPPHFQPEFEEILNNLELTSNVIVTNVQSLIDKERPRATPRADFGWSDYYPLDQVYAWLDAQVQKYPNIVTSIVGGSTYEGRQIKGVKISYKPGNPGIFIESGIHAREWITVATVTYIINELLTSEDQSIRNIAENFDWYIFPSTNPDGYEYTHKTNRMWRKTRSPGVFCYGADPNRNWDYHWMDTGASNNPCSETYAGNRVFSEVETRSLAQYATSIADKIQVYLCFHSYSQLLMLPYGLNYERPDNYETLMNIGHKSIAALAERYQTEYQVGTIYDIIYPASGGSMDWVKKSLNIPYTFEWELRDKGEFGFILPAEQIIPTALETLDSVLSILQDVQALEAKKAH